jgi:hypothetical protein
MTEDNGIIEKVSYYDKQRSFTDNWVKLIGMITIWMSEGEWRNVERGIDSLILILFKDEKMAAKKYKAELLKTIKTGFDKRAIYSDLLDFIITILEEKGFINIKAVDREGSR